MRRTQKKEHEVRAAPSEDGDSNRQKHLNIIASVRLVFLALHSLIPEIWEHSIPKNESVVRCKCQRPITDRHLGSMAVIILVVGAQ